MEKRIVKIWDLPSSGAVPALVILTISFLLGAVSGCLLASRVGGGGSDALANYLESYLAAAQSGGLSRPELLPLLWDVLRWPFLALLLGLTALGLLGLPILFVIRGFLLSFAIASFFRMFGGLGLLLSFAIFGVSGLVSIPVLFLLGVQGFLSAGGMASRLLGEGRRMPIFDRAYLSRCGMCAVAMCVCVCLEYFAVPALLETLAELVT